MAERDELLSVVARRLSDAGIAGQRQRYRMKLTLENLEQAARTRYSYVVMLPGCGCPQVDPVDFSQGPMDEPIARFTTITRRATTRSPLRYAVFRAVSHPTAGNQNSAGDMD